VSEADRLYREHRIWRRPGPDRALRYVVFENLATGQFTVQSCDFFPAAAESVVFLESNIGELVADEDPGEHGWHASVGEAIEAFDTDFAAELEDDIEDGDAEDLEVEGAEDEVFDDDEVDDDEFDDEDDEYKD
jgi:hypothetical protein